MFTPEQIQQLQAPLYGGAVKERSQAGRQLSYIEGWHAIAEANRIFGFGGWDRQTVEIRQLGEPREVDGKARVSYMARVRITVTAGETEILRDGCGYGSGIDRDLGQAHESALKEAETDAMKRALMTFGNPFGLALYDKTRENVTSDPPASRGATTPQLTQNGVKRLTSARAKEVGLDARIKDMIAACSTRIELSEWDADFDKHTAEAPLSWLDSIRNMIVLRNEELVAEAANETMNEAFRNTVVPAAAHA